MVIAPDATTVTLPLANAATVSASGPTDGGEVLLFPNAHRMRNFLVPPLGCSSIEAVITDCRNGSSADAGVEGDTDSKDDSSSRLVVLHALQTMRGTPYRKHEHNVYLRLTPRSSHTVS